MIKKLIPLMLVLALALAGCGSSSSSSAGAGANSGAGQSQSSSSSSSTTHFAKTKFVIHAGLAFGVFHHFIYKPFKAGELTHPLQHKFTTFKALAAGAIVIHEVHVALIDAKSSKILSKVVLPLTAMGAAVEAARVALLHHQENSSALANANADAAQANSASSSAGQPVSETTVGAGLPG